MEKWHKREALFGETSKLLNRLAGFVFSYWIIRLYYLCRRTRILYSKPIIRVHNRIPNAPPLPKFFLKFHLVLQQRGLLIKSSMLCPEYDSSSRTEVYIFYHTPRGHELLELHLASNLCNNKIQWKLCNQRGNYEDNNSLIWEEGSTNPEVFIV